MHDAANAGLLKPLPDPRMEEAKLNLYDSQLYGTDGRSPLAGPYENVDYGSQSRTNYYADELSYTPRIDSAQYYRPWPSPSGQLNHLVGSPQENDVLHTGEHSDSVESASQQQGNYIEANSALDFGDASGQMFSWGPVDTLSPEIGSQGIDHVSRSLQDATFQTERRSSVEHYPLLQTSNPGIIQMPSVSGVFNWTNGSEKNYLVGINRSLSVDPDFPNNARSRAQNSHISPPGSEPRRNSESSYQNVPLNHSASTVQPLAQAAQRGTKNSQSPAQDWSVMPYRMQSSGKDEFAWNPQELTKGAQADNPPPGNAETFLSPAWKPTNRVSSKIHNEERSDVSHNKDQQRPQSAPRGQHRVPTRGPKRKYDSDSPSPTTPPTKTKPPKRRFTASEKAEIAHKRKIGVCEACRKAKKRVRVSLQPSLYQCREAYCRCSACMCPLEMALPRDHSLSRVYLLPGLPLAGLRKE